MSMSYQQLYLFRLPKGFRGRPSWFVQLWWLTESLFFHTSPQIFYGWRVFLLKLFGAKIGKGCIIRPSASVIYPWNLELGDHVWIGDQVEIYCLEKIYIGSNSVISQRSYLCGGGHDYTSSSFDIFKKSISIGEQCWIATDVYIGPGVNIGEGTVVGARSSVYRDLSGGGIYVGNPARFIKSRLS